MRVLLVEDEVEIQSFLQRSLTEAGYQVDAAGDARTAERMSVESTHDVLVVDLELDLLRREATRSGEILNLTPQEFVLLEYLCRNAGRVVTRSMILDEVWGMRIQPDTNVVDVHIYRLRGKVDTDGRRPLIRTLRGVGYVLKDR